MKKVLFITLAGIMLLAFTQCGRETQEFKDRKAMYEKMEKAINESYTCDALHSNMDFLSFASSFAEQIKKYPENEKMTDKEKVQLEELSKKN